MHRGIARTGGAVFTVAVVGMAVLFAFSGRYGYFGDELYFIEAGRNLDWGYADQQPLVPLVALAMDTLFPGSLVALRAPAVLAFGAGAVVAATLARELGADRRAQVFTSLTFVLAFPSLFRNLNTIGFDILLWTLLTLLLVRWLRTHYEGAADDRLLLWSGVVVAIGIQVKFQIIVFAALLLVTPALVGPRPLLRRPLLWVGVCFTALTSAPTLVWQAVHGWPSLELSRVVTAEMDHLGGRLLNAVGMFALLGLVFGVVLGGYGLWRLLRHEDLRPYRFLGWTTLAVLVAYLALGGKPYYAAGLYPLLWAVGAVGFQRRREAVAGTRARWSWVAWPALAVSALVTVQSLPLAPIDSLPKGEAGKFNFRTSEIGWPKLATDIGEKYRALPRWQRQNTVVLTELYWSASAVDFYGAGHGLPDAFSGARGYWYFGHPPQGTTTVIHVGEIRPEVRHHFRDVREVGQVDNGHGIQNIVQGHPIYVARVDGVDWARVWPDFQRIAPTP